MQAKGSSHEDFKKQEPTHEGSKNTKMEMERKCVENQMGHAGEELPERTFCWEETLHRAEGHQGRSLNKKIRAASKEKLQKASWLKSRRTLNRRKRGARWMSWESRGDLGESRERRSREPSSCWKIITTIIHTLTLVSLWMNKGAKRTSKTNWYKKKKKKIPQTAVVGS